MGLSVLSQVQELQKANLKFFQETKVQSYGPNCWNAALIGSGIVKTTRMVTKPEMWFWLNSKQCDPVRGSESLRPTDVGSLFCREIDGHFHSFLRLDDKTVFDKRNSAKESSYKVQSFDNMLKENKCDSELDIAYHRCEPLPENFYSKHKKLKAMEYRLMGLLSTDFDYLPKRSSVPYVSENTQAVVKKIYNINIKERDHVPKTISDIK